MIHRSCSRVEYSYIPHIHRTTHVEHTRLSLSSSDIIKMIDTALLFLSIWGLNGEPMGSTSDVDLNDDIICYLLVEMATWVKINKDVEGIIIDDRVSQRAVGWLNKLSTHPRKKPYLLHGAYGDDHAHRKSRTQSQYTRNKYD